MERPNAKIDNRLARNKRSFVLLLHIRSATTTHRPTGRTITAVTIDPRPRSSSKYVRDRSSAVCAFTAVRGTIQKRTILTV